MKKVVCVAFIFVCLIFLSGCGKKSDVVIYSCMEEERNQLLEKQLKEKFKDLEVTVQPISTGNLAAKIKNEGKNMEADIVLDLETAHIENLKDNFADISSFDDSVYLDGLNNSDKYYLWTKYPLGIIIDKKYFEKNKLEIPKTYEDLLKPEYKDIIAMPDVKTSGSGYAFFLNAVNIMGEDEAVNYFKKLKSNLREFTVSGSGPVNLLKQGEIAIGMSMVSEGVQAITDGYDFEIIELSTGTPYNTTSFGIIDGREKNKNVGKVFEFLMNDFGPLDKSHYVLGTLYKDQENYVKNFDIVLNDADMNGVTDISTKEKLTERWNEVNG